MRSWKILFVWFIGFTWTAQAQIPERNQDPANPCTYNPSCMNEPSRQLPDYPYDPTFDPGVNEEPHNRDIYPDRSITPDNENIYGRDDILYDDRALDDPYDPNISDNDDLYRNQEPYEDLSPDTRDDVYRRDESPAGRDFDRGINDF